MRNNTNKMQNLRILYNMGNRFSSLTRFQPNIWLQSFEYCFTKITVKIECQTFPYYHVYLLRDIKFTGYVVNHFDTRKLPFARQKSIIWIKQKKSNFDIDKAFRALKMITWSFSAHHTEKRLNADYTLFFKLNWKVFKFVEIKICF